MRKINLNPKKILASLLVVVLLITSIPVSVFAADAVPSVSKLYVNDYPGVGCTVNATYKFTSVNGGEDQSLIEWLSADTKGGELTKVAEGKSYLLQPSDEGKWFTLRVTPKEAGIETAGTPVSWQFFCEIKPDHKPVASNYYIIGEPAVGERLILNYNYSDGNMDRERDTEVVWQRSQDGNIYTDITGVDTTVTDRLRLPAINYVLTEQDVGCYIRCKLIVKNSTSDGEPVYTDPIGVVYANPDVGSVAVAVSEGVATAAYTVPAGYTAMVWWETAQSENGHYVKIAGADGKTLNTAGLEGRYLRCVVSLADAQDHIGDAVYSNAVKLDGTIVNPLASADAGQIEVGNGIDLYASSKLAPAMVSMTIQTSSLLTVDVTSDLYDVFLAETTGGLLCTLVLKDSGVAIGDDVLIADIKADNATVVNVTAGIYNDDGSSTVGYYAPTVEAHGPLYGVEDVHISEVLLKDHTFTLPAGVELNTTENALKVTVTEDNASVVSLTSHEGIFFGFRSGRMGELMVDSLIADGEYHLYQVVDNYTGHHADTFNNKYFYMFNSSYQNTTTINKMFAKSGVFGGRTVDMYLSVKADDAAGTVYYIDKIIFITECEYDTGYTSDNNATCFADGTKSATCSICQKVDTVTDEGTKLTHSYTNYVSNGDATCQADGTKTALCDHGCKTKNTIADVGSQKAHSYTNYVSNGDATCNADGTETAECDYGCGTKDTRTAVGSQLSHKFTNYVLSEDELTKTASCDRGCGATKTLYAQEYAIDGIDALHITELLLKDHTFTLPAGVTLDTTENALKVDATVNPKDTSLTSHEGLIFGFRSGRMGQIMLDSVIADGEYHLYQVADNYTGHNEDAFNNKYFYMFTSSYQNTTTINKMFAKSGVFGGRTVDMYLSVKAEDAAGSVYYIDKIVIVTECEIGAGVPNGDATCQADGTKTGTCSICDLKVTTPDEGSKVPHKFSTYVEDSNGTTKTATCDYGCGTTSTLPIRDEIAEELAAINDAHKHIYGYRALNAYGNGFVLDSDAAGGRASLHDLAAAYAAGSITDEYIDQYWALDDELTIPMGVWTGRYDDSGDVRVPISTMIGELTKDDIIADGSYHMYKFNDVVAIEEDSYKYVWLFETMELQIKTEIASLYPLKGKTVDVYLSMKVTGDITCQNKADLPAYYIDRIIFVDQCEFEYTSNNDATCDADGTMASTCTICGAPGETVPDVDSALGHSFTNYVSNGDATCDADGTETAKCDRCDEKDTRKDEGSALGHSYGQWTQTKAPTCTEKGEEARKCTACEKTETREVAAQGHNLTKVEGVAATNEQEGIKEHWACGGCLKLFADAEGKVATTQAEVTIGKLSQEGSKDPTTTPDTGDHSMISLYAVVMVVMAACIVAISTMKKRRYF